METTMCAWPDVPAVSKETASNKTFAEFVCFMEILEIKALPIVLYTSESEQDKGKIHILFMISNESILEFVANMKEYGWMWYEDYMEKHGDAIPDQILDKLEF